MNAVFYYVLFIMSFLMIFTHVHIYRGEKSKFIIIKKLHLAE